MKYILIITCLLILSGFVLINNPTIINLTNNTTTETNGFTYKLGSTPDGINTITGVQLVVSGTGFYDSELQLIGLIKNSPTEDLQTIPMLQVQESAISVNVPFGLKNYNKNSLPDPSIYITSIIYLYSDTVSNRTVLWSDGFHWRKMSDNTVIN